MKLRVKINAKTDIYFANLGDEWFAKWMSTHHQGIWCRKHHDTKDAAVQCALARYLTWHANQEGAFHV